MRSILFQPITNRVSMLLSGLLLAGCISDKPRVTLYEYEATEQLGSLGRYPVFLGGISGLTFAGDRLLAITDRGPNTRPIDFDGDGERDRGFLVPDYQPRLLELEIREKTFVLLASHSLTIDGKPITGRPNVHVAGGKMDEIPFTVDGKRLPFDPNGVDSEGLAAEPNGNLWVAEEYGPSLLRIDSTGRVLSRLIPRGSKGREGQPRLPAVLAGRRRNRGFEGMTYHRDKLVVAMQSEIPGSSSDSAEFIVFDPQEKKTVGEFLYPFEAGRGEKIGAIASRDGRLLVLEHGKSKDGKRFRAVFQVNIPSEGPAGSLPLLEKELLVDLSRTRAKDFAKPEGMVVQGDSLIIAFDNDFGFGPSWDGQSVVQPSAKSYLMRVEL
jgi:hypothetical protein